MTSASRALPQPVPLVATTGSLLLGGSSTFLLNLLKVFGRRGYTLPIVVLSDNVEHQQDFERAQAEISRLATKKFIYEDRLAWGYREVARHQPRAVLACLSSESFEILRLVPPGVARIGIIQSDDPGPYLAVPAFAPWLDAMVGVSLQICQRLRSLPESARMRIEHIPYGIDFPPVGKRAVRCSELPLRIIYLGRVIEIQKRISRLAALIKLLDQRKANVKFTIVGSGPDDAWFRTAVAGCASVELRGVIPNHEVSSLLREQDVYILLSDFEGLPLSLLEAMAEGVVPVVSDLTSGLRDIVTEDCGVRVPIGDVEAAAQAIMNLASDRPRLAQLAEGATRTARETYSAESMATRYLSLVEDLSAPKKHVVWPAEVSVPAPQMCNPPWLYRGWLRKIRRVAKIAITPRSRLDDSWSLSDV